MQVELLDGVQNLLPACVDEQMQLGFSCLLDAYKMNENVQGSGLVTYSLGSQVVDRAEPREALRATVAWGIGLEACTSTRFCQSASALPSGSSPARRAAHSRQKRRIFPGGER